MGFDGYPAFKIQIAQEITNTNELLERFNVDKDTPEVVKRVMSDIQSTIVKIDIIQSFELYCSLNCIYQVASHSYSLVRVWYVHGSFDTTLSTIIFITSASKTFF